MKKSPFLFLLLGIFIVSCSIKKRSFRKGYYVDWVISKKVTEKEPAKVGELTENKNKDHVSNKGSISPAPEIFASADKSQILISENKTNVLPEDSCTEMIYFQDGTEIRARVLEIIDLEVTYKRCDNVEDRIYKIDTKDVIMIKYADGSIKGFESSDPFTSSRSSRKTHPKAVWAFVFSLLTILFALLSSSGIELALFFLVLFLIAMCIGIGLAYSAKKSILSSPFEFKGKGLATAAQIICFIFLGILIIGLFILLMLFYGAI